MRSAATIVTVLAGATIVSCSGSPEQESPASTPNLVFITVDTLRADRLGCYGYEQARTPVADRLAAQGTLFERAFTCLPRTTQSVATLFTGRYPAEHGVLEIGERLPNGAWTLAERLAERGYATAGISANSAACAIQGLAQGFQTFVGITQLHKRYQGVRPAEAVTREARSWLEQQTSGPYFLWLLYFDPHFPYEPPPSFAASVDPESFWFYEAKQTFQPQRPTIVFNLNGESARAQPELSRLYDGELAYTDSMIGELLEAVRARPDAADTLIVFTADHGESLGEHGYYYEHGDYVYETCLRVPLVLHQAGRIPAGRRVASPVSLVDVLPTVLTLLGGDATDDISGVDLTPLIRGELASPERPLAFAESGSALFAQNPRRHTGGRRSGLGRRKPFRYVRDGRWVLVRYEGSEGSEGRALYDGEADPALLDDLAPLHPDVVDRLGAKIDAIDLLESRWRMATDGRWKLVSIPELDGVRYELYDIEVDPGELVDRAAAEPQVVERLREELASWQRDLGPAERSEPMDAEQREEVERRLRALGYIE